MTEVKWVPVSVIAKVLGCSRQRVHQLCRDGRLVSRKMEKSTLVELRSAEEWIRGKQLRLLRDPRGGDLR